MEKERHRKAERLVAVQRQLKRAAETRHGEAVRERVRLDGETADLMAALDDGRFAPLMLENVARRLERVALARQQAHAAEATAADQVKAESFTLKRAERHADRTGRLARAEDERAATDAIAEASLISSGRASLA
ncbi:hypothetical protein [Xanthobacter aminoxidans]|uniref:hypothetical protein n=1 Tax=Xanthobacter aminoxidans TaxID=186280 RepID=UPI002023089D|nr:hypothetical protein [Xanthobacter aminoxidans]MCL8381142.1 hypothetical protein [Xanthobacter aminoxidans]